MKYDKKAESKKGKEMKFGGEGVSMGGLSKGNHSFHNYGAAGKISLYLKGK